MGRELRMVPPDWVHPKDDSGKFVPLLAGGFAEAVDDYETHDLPEWLEGRRLWDEEGKVKAADGIKTIAEVVAEAAQRGPLRMPPPSPTYEWWAGEMPTRPIESDYMPDFHEGTATHFMMYEDTSEGTPISPAFATAEELARWLTDTGASAFAGETASYEAWLATIKRGYAHSATMIGGRMISGVADTLRR